MPAPTKEDLEKFKNVDPGSFLKGNEPVADDIKDDVIITDDKKDPPAKQLKTQYEKTKKELEEAKKRLVELEGKSSDASELEVFRPVADYLKNKTGKLDKDVVEKELIEKNRNRKKELKEKEEKLALKDQQIKEISIEQSDEWQDEYVKPISKARDNLIASIVNVDKEGKIIGPGVTNALFLELTKVNEKGEAKTPVEIKQTIKVFADKYEKETGLDYEVPILREVVDAISTFHNKIITASKAKSDWDNTLDAKKKERIFEEETKRKSLSEKEVKARDYYFNQYKSNIDAVEMEEILGSAEEFTKAAEEEHIYLRNLLSQDPNTKPREYKDFIDLAARGKMFDKMVATIKELKSEIKSLKSDGKSPKFNGGAKASDQPIQQQKVTPGYDPTGFLK